MEQEVEDIRKQKSDESSLNFLLPNLQATEIDIHLSPWLKWGEVLFTI